MFLQIVLLSLIFGWFSVNCSVPVLPTYRKAELALNSYVSNPSYNPIIHSLLNTLIHDKRSIAFISDEAIEMALEQIKEFDQETNTNNEKLLRQVIYGTDCKRNENDCSSSTRQKINPPTPDLKHHIVLALDKFFAHTKTDDYFPSTTDNEKKD